MWSQFIAYFFQGIKFHYVESGERNQPLVLLLHGFPDCWLSWRYQMPALSEHFRVVALDLKGFGDSDKPLRRSSYRIDLILQEINQLITSLGVSSCTIIGHDLGALLGWYLVHQFPDLVDRFVSVSCPHPNIYWKVLPVKCAFNYQWINFVQLPILPEIDAMKEDLSIISECHKHLQQKDSEAYVEAYKYTFSRKEDWTGPINYFRNLPFSRISEKSSPTIVSTLLITGNKDNFAKLEGVVQSTDFCEKSVVKIVDGAGHFPHQEFPEEFNKVVMKFLKVRKRNVHEDKTVVSKGLMDRMFGAVSTTVKYGNTVLDTVQKRTNGVVGTIYNRGGD